MDRIHTATGSRKSARAKVSLIPGRADFEVNGRTFDEYFGRDDLARAATAPLRAANVAGSFGLRCAVAGGGLSAQAAAIALGAARALVASNPELRKPLKAADLMKRDPREKERMKYGLAKRRKRFQWTKR